MFHSDVFVWVFMMEDTFVACPAIKFMAMTREVWLVGEWTLGARPTEAGDVGRVRGWFCRKRPRRLIQAPSGPLLVERWRRRGLLRGTSKTWSLSVKVVTLGTYSGTGVTTSVARTEWSPAEVDHVPLAMWKHIEECLTWLWGVGVGDVEGGMAWPLRTPRQPALSLKG